MPIRPLEKKAQQSSLLKIIFLIIIVITGILLDKVFFKKNEEIPSILGKSQKLKQQTQANDFVNSSIKKAEEVGGVVLGEMADTLNKFTSDTGSFVSDVIYNNSIGKVVEQIDKLPKDQQEKIREQICK